MKHFEATNRTRIDKDSINEGGLYINLAQYKESYIERDVAEALREFFQAERDEELDNWRDPVLRNYVVSTLRRDTSVVAVHNEETYDRWFFTEAQTQGECAPELREAQRVAYKYFLSRRESQPWREAKPGDIWVITLEDGQSGPYRFGSSERFSHVTTGEVLDLRLIIHRKRIWPETKNKGENNETL